MVGKTFRARSRWAWISEDREQNWHSRVGYYGPFQIDVVAGEMKKVQLDCDTGMQ
jgi:hypothetical protein